MTLNLPTLRLPLRALACALAAAAGLTGTLLPGAAQAQAWPGKGPIKLVAVFPPGGSVDQVSRILAPVLQQRLGQTVVVDNKGGASGSIGTGAVAASPADGYTFAVVFDTHGVNPGLLPNLPFDSKRDLTAVSLIGTSAMVITTVATSPYKNFADLLAATRGGKNLAYGSIGSGSLGHLAVTLLAKNANLDLTHVPYRGGGPLMSDVIAGHVPQAIGSVFVSKPHIDSGRLRPLGLPLLRPLGTLRVTGDDEATLDEVPGSRYWAAEAPIAPEFFPYNRCTVWACGACGRGFLQYTEYGGYYVDHRLRQIDPALVG